MEGVFDEFSEKDEKIRGYRDSKSFEGFYNSHLHNNGEKHMNQFKNLGLEDKIDYIGCYVSTLLESDSPVELKEMGWLFDLSRETVHRIRVSDSVDTCLPQCKVMNTILLSMCNFFVESLPGYSIREQEDKDKRKDRIKERNKDLETMIFGLEKTKTMEAVLAYLYRIFITLIVDVLKALLEIKFKKNNFNERDNFITIGSLVLVVFKCFHSVLTKFRRFCYSDEVCEAFGYFICIISKNNGEYYEKITHVVCTKYLGTIFSLDQHEAGSEVEHYDNYYLVSRIILSVLRYYRSRDSLSHHIIDTFGCIPFKSLRKLEKVKKTSKIRNTPSKRDNKREDKWRKELELSEGTSSNHSVVNKNKQKEINKFKTEIFKYLFYIYFSIIKKYKDHETTEDGLKVFVSALSGIEKFSKFIPFDIVTSVTDCLKSLLKSLIPVISNRNSSTDAYLLMESSRGFFYSFSATVYTLSCLFSVGKNSENAHLDVLSISPKSVVEHTEDLYRIEHDKEFLYCHLYSLLHTLGVEFGNKFTYKTHPIYCHTCSKGNLHDPASDQTKCLLSMCILFWTEKIPKYDSVLGTSSEHIDGIKCMFRFIRMLFRLPYTLDGNIVNILKPGCGSSSVERLCAVIQRLLFVVLNIRNMDPVIYNLCLKGTLHLINDSIIVYYPKLNCLISTEDMEDACQFDPSTDDMENCRALTYNLGAYLTTIYHYYPDKDIKTLSENLMKQRLNMSYQDI